MTIFQCTFSGEFDQNKCKALDNKCEPCIERLPSCVGLSDGRHAFAGQLWTPKFILCHRNRTIEVTDCPDNKKFDPDQRFCVNPTIVGKTIFRHKGLCTYLDFGI